MALINAVSRVRPFAVPWMNHRVACFFKGVRPGAVLRALAECFRYREAVREVGPGKRPLPADRWNSVRSVASAPHYF